MVQETSRSAYANLDVSHQEAEVLTYLRSIFPESTCIADVAHALNWERSTVAGRMNGLKKKHLIEYDNKRPSLRTGIRSDHYKAKIQDTLF